MSTTVIWAGYGVIALLALLPVFSLLLAGGIAKLLGCRLDEGSAHPCYWRGRDLGNTLYGMAVAGWMALLSVPVGLGLAIVWSVVVWVG